MTGDRRGWRIALVPEALLNRPRRARATRSGVLEVPDVLEVLESSGYGALQVPPADRHSLLLAVIADQVAEYVHHGYAVVAIGMPGKPDDGLHWRRLAPLLRHRGVPLPPRHLIRPDIDASVETQRLAAFLDGYDLPPEEQRRWRV